MPDPNQAFVRILINDKSPRQSIGAGFLVAPRLVLSCAHVILDALKLPENISQTLFLDFPFVDNQPLITAKVLKCYPELDNPHVGDIEDLVLLELTKEVAYVTPLALVVLPNDFNRPVKLTGFPKGKDEGVHLSGTLKGLTGEGRVQIDTEQGRGDVAPGFSGSAVYDIQENAVVGIVVIKDSYGGNVRAYMIPTVTVIKAFPQLEQLTRSLNPYKNGLSFQRPDVESFSRERRLRLIQLLESQPPQVLNKVIYVVNPPSSLIPSTSVPQSDRIYALLSWADTPFGCGLTQIETILEETIKPSIDYSSVPVITSKRLISRLPPVTRLFTDRTEVLSKLRKVLEQENIVAVTGLPAVGKTQATLQYIEKNKESYKTIIWLIGTSVSELEKTIEDFVSSLELFHAFSKDIRATYNTFIKWLQYNDGWLVVLDNLKSLDIARDIINLSTNGHIIITSRVSFRENFAEIHIIPFEGDNAALFFIRRAFQEFRQSSLCDIPPELVAQANNIIAKQLSRHPLVLEYSAALIAANHWDLNTFMDKLKARGKKLVLSENTPTNYDYPETLGITFKLCFDEVQAYDIVATDILRVCAFLSPELIPLEIFTCTGYELGDNIANAISEESRFDIALRILLRYSLIERDRKDITNISIQTIVQDIIREQMTREESFLWADRVINALNKLFPSPDFKSWNECNRLLAHTLRFAEEWISNYALTSKPVGCLLTRLAAYQFERGKLESVETFLLQAIEIFQHIGMDIYKDKADTRMWLAKLYECQGKFDDALINIDDSIRFYKNATSIENLDTAKALLVKGTIVQQYEKYSEAKKYYKSAILIIEKSCDQQSDERCRALYLLGGLYYEQGKYSFAKKFYEKSLNLLKDIPNRSDIIEANILNNLGLLYSDIGDIKNADATLQKAIAIWQTLDIEHHFEYGCAIHNLGRVYIFQGKDVLAEEAFEKALSIWNRGLSQDHHLNANSYDHLAVLFLKRGELEKAKRLIEESKKIRERVFGDKNSELGLSNYMEGVLFLCKENSISSALNAFIKAKVLIQKRGSRYHPYMIHVLIGIGECYFLMEDYEKSYNNFKEALKNLEKNQGYENPTAIDVYHCLAVTCRALRQNDKADEMYKNALKIAHKILEPTHPLIVSVTTDYASYLKEVGRKDDADKLK
jgi:tetratricopeptide (TPR) repeat protein